MATDHALARRLGEGEAVLRFYQWEVPTLSFGRNQRARGAYREEDIRGAGMDLVRRPTGGRAVLHHQELTYAVVLPLRTLGGLRDVYRKVNEGLVLGLTRLGVPAAVSGATGTALPPEAGACFQAPAEGEVVVGGRKLVGSAQARVEGALLQHGSLLLAGDQRRAEVLDGSGANQAQETSGAYVTLSEVLAEPPELSSLIRELAQGVGEVLGGEWRRAEPTSEEETVAEELRKRYESPDWTWRR